MPALVLERREWVPGNSGSWFTGIGDSFEARGGERESLFETPGQVPSGCSRPCDQSRQCEPAAQDSGQAGGAN